MQDNPPFVAEACRADFDAAFPAFRLNPVQAPNLLEKAEPWR
jgi:hypothetical protein